MVQFFIVSAILYIIEKKNQKLYTNHRYKKRTLKKQRTPLKSKDKGTEEMHIQTDKHA